MLYVLAFVAGLSLLLFAFLIPPLFEPSPAHAYAAMFVGAVMAVPAGLMYLTVPRLLDRYDPEPWYALVGCLMWGGIVSCGFAAIINSTLGAIAAGAAGPQAGEIVSAVISAPIVEESFKCLGVFGVFYFLRREFDGVVDGVIYATFTALGFAMVENILYYAQGMGAGDDMFRQTLIMRGLMSPWAHPVYTSMFGIGIGLTRESKSGAVKVIAPILGFLGAVLLHAIWNASATFAGGVLFVVLFPMWLAFVAGFLTLVMYLVGRRGRIIRDHLLDEVALGTIDQSELELVCSKFGIVKARMQHGRPGAEFVRATARLALHKWHAARAMETSTQTISMDFIVPLRQRIAQLRQEAFGAAR